MNRENCALKLVDEIILRLTCLRGENKVYTFVVLVVFQQAKIIPKNFVCVEKAGDKNRGLLLRPTNQTQSFP